MIDTKTTLQNLHKRFPDMNLDELFAILECISEFIYPAVSWTESTYCKDPILGQKVY